VIWAVIRPANQPEPAPAKRPNYSQHIWQLRGPDTEVACDHAYAGSLMWKSPKKMEHSINAGQMESPVPGPVQMSYPISDKYKNTLHFDVVGNRISKKDLYLRAGI
jgi:hypothetical protein